MIEIIKAYTLVELKNKVNEFFEDKEREKLSYDIVWKQWKIEYMSGEGRTYKSHFFVAIIDYDEYERK